MSKLMRTMIMSATVLATAVFALPNTSSADDYWNGYWRWYDNDYRPYHNRHWRRDYRNDRYYNRRYYNDWDDGYYYRGGYGYRPGWNNRYYNDGYYYGRRGWDNDGGYLQLGPLGVGWD